MYHNFDIQTLPKIGTIKEVQSDTKCVIYQKRKNLTVTTTGYGRRKIAKATILLQG